MRRLFALALLGACEQARPALQPADGPPPAHASEAGVPADAPPPPPDAPRPDAAVAPPDAPLADATVPKDAKADATPDAPVCPVGPDPGCTAAAGCALATAQAGELVPVPLDPVTAPEPPLVVDQRSGRLLHSHSPRGPTGAGILYRDEVAPAPLVTRLWFAHGNASPLPKKLGLVLENAAGNPTALAAVVRRGLVGPGTSLPAAGRDALHGFLAGSTGETIAIPGGEARVIDAALDAIVVGPGEFVHGIYDLSAEAGLVAYFTWLDAGQPTEFTYRTPPFLLRDGIGLRGTFGGADRRVKVASPCQPDGRSGTWRIRLGGNTGDLPAVSGYDDSDGAPTHLYGDRGARVRVDLELRPPAGERIAVVLAPRELPYTGAITVSTNGATPVLLDTPARAAAVTGPGTGVIVARGGAETDLSIVWSGPAGATMPVDLLLIPVR